MRPASIQLSKRPLASGRFYGCIASAGNAFYNVNLTIDFPDSQTFVFPVLDTTDRAAEARFRVEVRRASVSGASATIYCDQSRR